MFVCHMKRVLIEEVMQLLDAAAGKEFKYGTKDIPLDDEEAEVEAKET